MESSPVDVGLVESWTLVDGDWDLIAGKRSSTRLGFSVMLKFFELHARFPADGVEVPADAVWYVADQVGVDPDLWSSYDVDSRASFYHRREIRDVFGFSELRI